MHTINAHHLPIHMQKKKVRRQRRGNKTVILHIQYNRNIDRNRSRERQYTSCLHVFASTYEVWKCVKSKLLSAIFWEYSFTLHSLTTAWRSVRSYLSFRSWALAHPLVKAKTNGEMANQSTVITTLVFKSIPDLLTAYEQEALTATSTCTSQCCIRNYRVWIIYSVPWD